MKILKVAVGNQDEAYIEERINDGLNIISSDDNNKGKTILIQSMMYALGNEPAFPASFEYQNYTYYIEFEVDNKKYCLIRKGNCFVIKSDSNISIFDNVSEFKRFWNNNIFALPVIPKDGTNKIVDPVLFVQLFFVGQDDKDTSNIANKGYYKKDDFIEMLYSIYGLPQGVSMCEDIEKLREKLISLKDERDLLLKQNAILESNKTPITYLSTTSDRMAFQDKVKELKKQKEKVEKLRKQRNTITVKKLNWESTLKELRSINRNISSGKLVCMDCGSTNISFSGNGNGNSYSFDISTVELRNQILSIIKDKIEAYEEEIEKLNVELAAEQDKLNDLLKDEDITLEALVLCKEEVFNSSDADKRLSEINTEIRDLDAKIKFQSDIAKDVKEKRNLFFLTLIAKMNELYKHIDGSGNTTYTGLFTPKTQLYSGSEAIVFYTTKILAYQSVLQHDYPIIIDSFRAEDLSTQKEDIIIDLFQQVSNQVILTTTLKTEETGKYDNIADVNHINYCSHTPYKILQLQYVGEFRNLLSALSIKL